MYFFSTHARDVGNPPKTASGCVQRDDLMSEGTISSEDPNEMVALGERTTHLYKLGLEVPFDSRLSKIKDIEKRREYTSLTCIYILKVYFFV